MFWRGAYENRLIRLDLPKGEGNLPNWDVTVEYA